MLHPSITSFLSPVRVFPTTEQINNSTIITTFNQLNQQHNNICPIRNEEFTDTDIVIQINHCGHTFYPNEFYGWFRDHVHCPLCRYDIRQDASSNITDTSLNSISSDEIQIEDNVSATDNY